MFDWQIIILSAGIWFRCLVTVVMVLFYPDYGVLGYCIAQVAFTCSLCYYTWKIFLIHSLSLIKLMHV